MRERACSHERQRWDMKITTNFIGGVQQLTGSIVATMWLMALLVLGALVWLVVDGVGLRSELPELRERLPKLEAAAAAASHQELPPEQEMIEIRDRVARLNAITQTRGLTTLALLTKLETLLPGDAVLAGVRHRARDGELVVVAQAANAEILSKLLQRLEEDVQFESVVLARQKEVNDGGRVAVQFEIRAKVRS